ncbi:MAG: NAD(P)/FAD-dependent oxidoreductase, partial [Thermoleophilia bacterium]
ADRANVGVAVAGGAGIRPAVALRSFAARLAGEGLIELDGAVATGGLIPVGGPLACRAGDILLAGDAAGHCHPLTGAGIATAVQCGELAGRAAAESLATGSSTPLRQYEEEVEELFGEHLRQAAESRRKLYRHWDAPANDLCRALRRAWVGCSGYNRRDDG